MNSTKFLTGTLVGGIAFFFLGYLIYGLALGSFFREHSVAAPGAMKSMSEIVWWALILGNLASGALITWIFLKLGTVTSFGSWIPNCGSRRIVRSAESGFDPLCH